MKRNYIVLFLLMITLVSGCGNKVQENSSNEGVIEESTEITVDEYTEMEDKTLENTNNEANTIYTENLNQYVDVLHLISTSPIEGTILAMTTDEENKWFLVDSEENILCELQNREEAYGIFLRKEKGDTKIYKGDFNDLGEYVIEDVTNLFMSDTSEHVKVTTDTPEPIIWVSDIIETVEDYDYILTAYDKDGNILNQWNRSDFETDKFIKPYNPDDIFERLAIYYKGEDVYYIEAESYESSFLICLDSEVVMPLGNGGFEAAYNGKIFVEGVCYDTSGNLLWNKEYIEENIIIGQYSDCGLIGYLQGESIIFLNMDGNIEFEIPLIGRIIEFDGYTKDCPYAAITYINGKGTRFTTLYDREGNMLYEPVKGDMYSGNEDSIKLRRDGYLILDDEENLKLVDISGNIVINFERDTYSNEFAVAENKLFQFCVGQKKIIIHDIQ